MMVEQTTSQPQGEQTQAPQPAQAEISQPSAGGEGGIGKIFGVIVALVLAIVLLVGGSVVLAAMTDYKVIPLPEQYREQADDIAAFLPVPKSPEFLLRVGSRRLIKKGSYKTDIELEASSDDFVAKFGGSMPVVMDQQQTAAEISFFVDIKTQETFRLEGDWKMINDKNYFRIKEVPEISFLDLSAIKGKWFYTTVEQVQAEKQGLSEEQQRQLAEAMAEFFSKVELRKEGQVACVGGSCTKVMAIIQGEDITWLLGRIAEIMQKETMDAVSYEELKEAFAGPVEVTFLIGKKDNLLYEAEMKMSIKMAAVSLPTQGMMPEGIGMLGGLQQSLDLTLKASFSEFGKRFEVVEPTGASDIKTLDFSQLFSSEKIMEEKLKEEMEKRGLEQGTFPSMPPLPSLPPGLLPSGLPIPKIP